MVDAIGEIGVLGSKKLVSILKEICDQIVCLFFFCASGEESPPKPFAR